MSSDQLSIPQFSTLGCVGLILIVEEPFWLYRCDFEDHEVWDSKPDHLDPGGLLAHSTVNIVLKASGVCILMSFLCR